MLRFLGILLFPIALILPWPALVDGATGIISHESARGVYVSHANALSTQIVGPDGRPAIVDTSGRLLTATAHVASNQMGVWNVNAHQVGVWTIAHVTSVTHVAGTVQANTGSGTMTCHSVASFATSASVIVAHAAGANRLFICGIVLVSSAAQSVSIVEGTGAACVTSPAAVLGSTDAANGIPVAANGGMSSIAPFPWLATRTAGNNLCLLLSGSGRVSGVITYRGAP